MIRRLRVKFILLSMLALFVLLAGIMVGVNALNYGAVLAEADGMLELLTHNRGEFPEMAEGGPPPHLSPEAPYDQRYFWVVLGPQGQPVRSDTGRIRAVTPQQAEAYALQIAADGRERGFVDRYRFLCRPEGGGLRITFLDCGRSLDSFRTFLWISTGMALAGYGLFFFVILFFSGRIIRPVSESYEKQKRFITDAGHEIRTPLTVIRADADVLEMEYGESEWLTDIQRQAQRLAELTDDLVYLSRMEEAGDRMPMIEFPLSDVLTEAAASFQALAQTQGKTLNCSIEPMLSVTGNDKAIHQLVGILLDNAVKYSPAGGSITLRAARQGKGAVVTVTNTTAEPIPRDRLELLFDRFYRVDPSRSSQTGGYGIGLSVARAIVTAHGGRIQAGTGEGPTLIITVTLPG